MPRSPEMCWVKSGRRDENRPKMWKKVYRKRVFTVSCRQLREQGYAVFSDTKEGSYLAANEWWKKKRAEIDSEGKPAPRPPELLEDLVAAAMGEPVDELGTDCPDEPGVMQYRTEEGVRRMVKILRPGILEDLIQGRLDGIESLPPARIQQIEDSVKGLRGESAAPPDKTVQAHAERWLQRQQAVVAAGQMTASRCANNRTCLEHLKTFLGPQVAVDGIDGPKLDGFYLYCAGKIRRDGATGGWSVAYAKDVFSVARSFIRWAWEQGACELPRNIKVKFKFGSSLKAVTTWTPGEFKRAVEAAPGKLKLALLLMANIGATQKDVSDLLDSEVDWVGGRIVRRRSKTASVENAPVVNYKLWPLTFELLQKYRSGKERVLLTEKGQPFVRTHLNATGKQVKADGFASNYVHLKKRLGMIRPLKQLRKLGASLLGTHKDYGRFSSFFLGHSPRTVADKNYLVPPKELFDEAVLWLGEQLGQVHPKKKEPQE